jgi:hypothetical protein
MPDDASQWRALIRQQRLCITAEQLQRARRVGATPDPATMRGAEPSTCVSPPMARATTQRHAAHRIPADHPGAHRLEQLHAGGISESPAHNGRLYANACALLAMWIESGLGASAVADYQPRERPRAGDIEQQTAEDEMRRLMARRLCGYPCGHHACDPVTCSAATTCFAVLAGRWRGWIMARGPAGWGTVASE